jgi:hypothetical protein
LYILAAEAQNDAPSLGGIFSQNHPLFLNIYVLLHRHWMTNRGIERIRPELYNIRPDSLSA